MAEHKIEPVEDIVKEASAPSQTENAQSTPSSPEVQKSPPASAPQPCTSKSLVRNSVLDEVVAHHEQRIAELERRVEKKKETFRRLSNPSSFIPPPGLGVVPSHPPPPAVPPGSAAPPSPAVQLRPNQTNPLSASGNPVNTTQQQQQQSQPLAHNPAMAATMAAITAASTPAASAALHPQYPFFPYPHPDNPVMAAPFMGVMSTVPSHPVHPTVQPPAPPQPSQPNPASEDGGNRQSRYWTRDEHQRFLAAVSTYGSKNYQQIAEVVGTRSARQVRTHSQKYQKKLEREEARRRGEGRTPSNAHSPAPTSAAAPAGLSDCTHAQKELLQSDIHPRGQATSSSKNLNVNEAPQSAKSAEGSSSTNNASSERNAENSTDAVHANAKAAAAAVFAEAVALGGGRLPPGAISLLSKTHAANSANSGIQAQTMLPRESEAIKPNGSQNAPALDGATSTKPGKTMEVRNKATSPVVNCPSSRANASAVLIDAKASTSIPAGRGAESHQVAEQMFGQKLQVAAEAIAPSQRPSHSSVNGAVMYSRVDPDKKLLPRPAQSAVKIEPRIAVSERKGDSLPGPLPTLTTNVHSELSALPSTTSLQPEMETVNTKSSKNIAKPVVQKPTAEVPNAGTETEVVSRGLIISGKEASTPAHRKDGIVPNGKHGAPTSPRMLQAASGVPNKLDVPQTCPPTGSTQIARSASVPSVKLDTVGDVSNSCETTGNSEVLGKSRPISPSKVKTAEQPNKRIRLESAHEESSDPEAPRRSESKQETTAKDALAARKENDFGVQPSISKSAAQKAMVQERKLECVHKGDMDTSDGHISLNGRDGRGTCGRVGASQESNKSQSVESDSRHPSQEVHCKSVALPNRETMVSTKDSRAYQVVGKIEKPVEENRKIAVPDRQVEKQCVNQVSVGDAAPNGPEPSKAYPQIDGDTRKEAEGRSCLEQVDSRTEENLDGTHHGGARGQCEEKKLVEQDARNAERIEKMKEVAGSEEKGEMKRALENVTDSVAKRQKGSDKSSKFRKEENGIGDAVQEVKKR